MDSYYKIHTQKCVLILLISEIILLHTTTIGTCHSQCMGFIGAIDFEQFKPKLPYRECAYMELEGGVRIAGRSNRMPRSWL